MGPILTKKKELKNAVAKGRGKESILRRVFEAEYCSETAAGRHRVLCFDWLCALGLWERERDLVSKYFTTACGNKADFESEDPLMCALELRLPTVLEKIVGMLLNKQMLRFVWGLNADLKALFAAGPDYGELAFRLLDEGGIHEVDQRAYRCEPRNCCTPCRLGEEVDGISNRGGIRQASRMLAPYTP